MKKVAVHGCWALVTLLVAGVWGRYVQWRTAAELRSADPARPSLAGSLPSAPYPERVASSPLSAAAPVVGVAPTSAAAPGAPLTPDQIRAMLRSREQWARAFDALKGMEDRPLKLSILGELFPLGSVDRRIPTSAYLQLAEMGGADAAEVIEKGLLIAEDDTLRSYAAEALGKASGPRSVGVLLDLYRSGSLDVKVTCAKSLNILGFPGPASEMIATLSRALGDADGAIRRDAVANVAYLQSPAAFPVLAQALKDSNGDVRSEAISGLAALGIPDVIPLLEQSCNDPNPSVADEAKKALEKLRNPEKK